MSQLAIHKIKEKLLKEVRIWMQMGHELDGWVCTSVNACVRACVCVCLRVRACVREYERVADYYKIRYRI